jgi:hypothetical protein
MRELTRALEIPAYSTVIDASDYIRALCQAIRRTKLDLRDIDVFAGEVHRPIRKRGRRRLAATGPLRLQLVQSGREEAALHFPRWPDSGGQPRPSGLRLASHRAVICKTPLDDMVSRTPHLDILLISNCWI